MGLEDRIASKILLAKISSWEAKGILSLDRVVTIARATSARP